MTRLLLFLATAFPALAETSPAPTTDLLRLSNGELEGHFAGLDSKGVLRWERDDGIAPMEFKTDKVRQIILRGGKAMNPGQDAAHVTLINGDRVPGRIISLDDERVMLDTKMAGTLTIERSSIVSISPNPFGGRLIYAGPFSEEGWRVYNPAEQTEEPQDDDEEEEEANEEKKGWKHIGSRWYFTGGRDALLLEAGMPEKSSLSFKLEWRNRPPLAIAFYADFAGPKPVEPDDEGEEEPKPARKPSSNHMADCFGNAFVLTLRNSYANLQHCGFNDDGEPVVSQIRSSATNVRFEDTGEATFEIRTNRRTGVISLFVNGSFSMQWSVDKQIDGLDRDGGVGSQPTGSGIGFQTVNGETPVRISDVIIAEWNGMPDSARSLESEDLDMVLLTNGTDRFSGKVTGVKDEQLHLEGRYAELAIPLEEIAELLFAKKSLSEPAQPLEREVRIHFQPLGRVSGTPGIAKNGKMKINSPLFGDTVIDLDPAVILEFQSGTSFLNYWDEDL